MTKLPENTPSKQRGLRQPWQSGQSGNPAGRPKGSRNKLSEAFWHDLAGAWEKHGVAAIERMAQEEPWKFVQTVASVMPKQFEVNPIENMTDEQILSRLVELDRQLADSVPAWRARRFPAEADATLPEATEH